MRPKQQPQNQLSFLAPSLKEQLNPKHPLYLLTHHIDWNYFEGEFAKLYSHTRTPSSSHTPYGLAFDSQSPLQPL